MPLTSTVGSKVPSSAFVTAVEPEAIVVHTCVGDPASVLRLYSSFHVEPSLTLPMKFVRLVIVDPSAGELMLTTAGGAGGLTWTVTSSLVLNSESLAVRRKTYVPGVLNDAIDAARFCGLKPAWPGPLTTLHNTESVLPAGTPSSVAVPLRIAVPGNVITRSGPAFTTGALLFGLTVIVTSAKRVISLSKAVRRNTYVPATVNVAVVCAWFALPKVTRPGPLTLDHVTVSVLPAG